MHTVTPAAQGCASGDGYWDDVYARSRPVLFRTAAFLLPMDEAEEVVQDAFERALRIVDFREAVESPIAWLRTTTVRLAVDRLRRRALWERVRHLVVPWTSTDARSSELREALGCLPAKQRAALVMRYYNDAPYAEIAAAVGIRPESVGPLLTRAKRALAEVLLDA